MLFTLMIVSLVEPVPWIEEIVSWPPCLLVSFFVVLIDLSR